MIRLLNITFEKETTTGHENEDKHCQFVSSLVELGAAVRTINRNVPFHFFSENRHFFPYIVQSNSYAALF